MGCYFTSQERDDVICSSVEAASFHLGLCQPRSPPVHRNKLTRCCPEIIESGCGDINTSKLHVLEQVTAIISAAILYPPKLTMDYILTSFKAVSIIFSILAVQTGINALFRPISFAKSFGLPMDNNAATKSRAGNKEDAFVLSQHSDFGLAYVTMMGVRQLATGITILIFSSLGKWTEIATILSVLGLLVATTDAYNLWKAGKNGLARYHALPGIAIALHALAVLYRDDGT